MQDVDVSPLIIVKVSETLSLLTELTEEWLEDKAGVV